MIYLLQPTSVSARDRFGGESNLTSYVQNRPPTVLHALQYSDWVTVFISHYDVSADESQRPVLPLPSIKKEKRKWGKERKKNRNNNDPVERISGGRMRNRNFCLHCLRRYTFMFYSFIYDFLPHFHNEQVGLTLAKRMLRKKEI